MNEWKTTTLGHLSTQRKGINYKSDDYGDEHSGHPFITIKCFVKGGGYQPTGIKFYDGFSTKADQLSAGDILFSVTDLTRAGDIVGSPLRVPDFGGVKPPLASMDCMRVEPVADRCDKGFLYHRLMLSDVRRQMVAYSAGSTVLHLDTKKVPSIAVRVPVDIRIQSKITFILDGIDTAIEKTEALIAKYQQIKAGLMHDLFTRGVLPNGQLRPPRREAPELYQETEIGWILRDWDVSGLAVKSRPGTSWIRTGPFGSALKGEHWRTHGHPVITIGALGEGVFTPEELLFVDTKDAARLIDFQLKAGDVVFSRVADVGRSVVVRNEQAGWIMSSNLMRLAIDESKTRPDFLQMALAGDARIKSQIRTRVNSGGRDVANSDVLSQLRFVWPDITEQDQIIALSDRASCRLNLELKNVAKLRTQKLGLMQDLLTGKVPVQVNDPEVADA
ncbi:MAG: restriction endonuclease subunit S domain-containing protein [Acidiferrobacter sp.]